VAPASRLMPPISPFKRACCFGVMGLLGGCNKALRPGDRLARSQLEFVHRNTRYDITIDTSEMSPCQARCR
jgi:chloramphenicol 3-O-phosphotransferase